jgi:methylthioribose-1-phosphate isomerase
MADYDSVTLNAEGDALVIIDQTALPGRFKTLSLTTVEEVFDAIRTLQVRGAPAIGVAAAGGLYLAARSANAATPDALVAATRKAANYLVTARPTAVNLSWALSRMMRVLEAAREPSLEVLLAEARAIHDEDIATCRAIGEAGLTLLRDGDGVLTHCNAGRLATVRYGTALAPLHLGRERGMRFRVYCDETRPLLQGARLTAYELKAAGIDTTLICDNMAAQVLKNGWVNVVLVGADRIAANGDTANKIGTSGVAILAAYYHVPFYVAAPWSTIDATIATGNDIVIEERSGAEVTTMWYSEPMAPAGVKVFNPAFDVTPASLIAGIITERGILRPPYGERLRAG